MESPTARTCQLNCSFVPWHPRGVARRTGCCRSPRGGYRSTHASARRQQQPHPHQRPKAAPCPPARPPSQPKSRRRGLLQRPIPPLQDATPLCDPPPPRPPPRARIAETSPHAPPTRPPRGPARGECAPPPSRSGRSSRRASRAPPPVPTAPLRCAWRAPPSPSGAHASLTSRRQHQRPPVGTAPRPSTCVALIDRDGLSSADLTVRTAAKPAPPSGWRSAGRTAPGHPQRATEPSGPLRRSRRS
eukprot:scaffold23020_cov118-Isochrysis_galbana.AAC.2